MPEGIAPCSRKGPSNCGASATTAGAIAGESGDRGREAQTPALAALRCDLRERAGRRGREIAGGIHHRARLHGAGIVDADRDRARLVELET